MPGLGRMNELLMGIDDAATAVRKMRGDFPGQDKEAKKAGEEGLEAIRARAEDLVCRFSISSDHCA